MEINRFRLAFGGAARDPFFLGHAILRRCGTPEIACERLGVSLDTLQLVALCQAPAAATWDTDLNAVCRRFGMDRVALERLLR